MIEKRPYQLRAGIDLRATAAALPAGRPRRVLLQAETGAGKSVIALDPIEACYRKGRRALFVARGRELVTQFSGHLTAAHIPHGVLMRGESKNLTAPVQ